MSQLTVEKISQGLSHYDSQLVDRFSGLFLRNEIKNARQAAVIIPILEVDGRWHVLLTRRSDDLVEHRGQVAFPGGAMESQDEDLQWTALREMHEEVGIQPSDVKVLGTLGDMPVITGYMVRLFVGKIPWPYKLEINHDEVATAFIIPLDWLADSDHRTIQYRTYQGGEIPVIFFDNYDGQQLWGASAEMTLILLDALQLLQ
jgi:8-oxo-dGTP pyrophosphatase MutT (NUDIX family)